MTNHVHFLVTPGDSDSVSFATKVIGSRYAQYFNKTYKRTGTLWEGRHKSSLVQSERFILTCSRYMRNAWGGEGIIEQHIEYLKLDEEPEARRHAYRELFRYSISSEDIHIIEDTARYSRPLGDSRFSEQIASQFGVVIPRAIRGRPRLDGK